MQTFTCLTKIGCKHEVCDTRPRAPALPGCLLPAARLCSPAFLSPPTPHRSSLPALSSAAARSRASRLSSPRPTSSCAHQAACSSTWTRRPRSPVTICRYAAGGGPGPARSSAQSRLTPRPRPQQVLVLDEADRILDLGFRETLDAILANLPPQRQTMVRVSCCILLPAALQRAPVFSHPCFLFSAVFCNADCLCQRPRPPQPSKARVH